MAQFILTYVGGNHDMPQEEQQANMQRWMAWMKENAAVMVVPQQPLTPMKMVSASGIADATGPRFTGYSIVEVADEEAAFALAKSCPFLDIEGEIGVAALVQMNG